MRFVVVRRADLHTELAETCFRCDVTLVNQPLLGEDTEMTLVAGGVGVGATDFCDDEVDGFVNGIGLVDLAGGDGAGAFAEVDAVGQAVAVGW